MSELAMKVIQWQANGRLGVSSATMASIALGLSKNIYSDHFDKPYDPADLKRCADLVDAIPEIRKSFPKIGRRVNGFKPILDNWDELVELLREEEAAGNRAPRTYQRMKELLGINT